MPLDFPNSPTVGATYTGPGGVVWTYDGAKWASGASTTAFAPIDSPAFTGDPTAPTPAYGDNDTSVATTAFVQAAVAPMTNNVGRNLIHNSLFNVAQRGAGPFTTTGALYAGQMACISLVDSHAVSSADALNDANARRSAMKRRSLYSAAFYGSGAAATSRSCQQSIEACAA